MTEMTMNRAIHAAVRRDLARLESALRTGDDGDRDRFAELALAWDHLHGRLSEHHETEDALIWPALAGLGVDPALLHTMEGEHQEMSAALREADEAVKRVAATAYRADRLAAAASVRAAQQVVERHFAHEEGELEPLLLERRETPQWQAVEKKLRRRSPKTGGEFFAWLLDGSEPAADAYVRSQMPRPVLTLMSRGFGAGYHRCIAPVWRA